jgi:hypothetical protein
MVLVKRLRMFCRAGEEFDVSAQGTAIAVASGSRPVTGTRNTAVATEYPQSA